MFLYQCIERIRTWSVQVTTVDQRAVASPAGNPVAERAVGLGVNRVANPGVDRVASQAVAQATGLAVSLVSETDAVQRSEPRVVLPHAVLAGRALREHRMIVPSGLLDRPDRRFPTTSTSRTSILSF